MPYEPPPWSQFQPYEPPQYAAPQWQPPAPPPPPPPVVRPSRLKAVVWAFVAVLTLAIAAGALVLAVTHSSKPPCSGYCTAEQVARSVRLSFQHKYDTSALLRGSKVTSVGCVETHTDEYSCDLSYRNPVLGRGDNHLIVDVSKDHQNWVSH